MQSLDTFEMKHKNVYSYEVLGGLHTLMAKSQLMVEIPDNPCFKNCLAEVYVGLSDEEALRLSQRHNQTSHFVHSVTHRDLVEACRARLFKLACLDLEVDETPKPTAAWKESCIKAIIPQDVSKTQRDAIFSQATMPKPVWILAIKVMDLFKKSKLKGQKLKLSSLMSEPDFKQQYLTPIRTLPESDQCHLLQRLINCEITIADLKEAAANIKQMDSLKKAFLKLVNFDTWEEAEEKLPVFATQEQLQKFSKLDLKRGIPQSFIEYCSRAKQSLEQLPESSDVVISSSDSQCSLYVVHSTFTELCSNKILATYEKFTGVSLAVVCFDKEATAEKITSVSYTIKEINSANSYNLYTVVAISDPSNASVVANSWSAAFMFTDVLYYADKDAMQGNPGENTIFTHCVRQLVFGFFSVNNNGAKHHMTDPSDQLSDYFQGTKKELYSFLIEKFSFPGSIVLDMTGCQGILSETAIKAGRNAICITENDNCAELIAQFSSALE